MFREDDVLNELESLKDGQSEGQQAAEKPKTKDKVFKSYVQKMCVCVCIIKTRSTYGIVLRL